jgi:hypothetical protein
MVNLKIYLNNVLINPPKNLRELAVEVNFQDGEFANQQLTINDFEFVRENIDAINAWITAGFIFEGMPLRIEETDLNGVITTFFDGYIDLSDQTQFDEYGIVAKSKPKYSIDWLNDVATGFSFDFLYTEAGIITQSDFVDIPYVISSIPDYEKLAITVIGLTLIIDGLVAAANSLGGAIASVITASPDWGNYFLLIGEILKFTGLMIAAFALIKRMFAVIIQRVKYHKAIPIRTLFIRGCQYLGLSFQSSIILANDVILPKKYYVPKNPSNPFNLDLLGAFTPNEFVQYGFPDGTFADFIIKMKDLYNGKVLFNGNQLLFERKDFQIATPQYTIPSVINTKYQLNTDEFTSNFVCTFQTDVSESNTITEYLGTNYQVTLRPINIINSQFVLMKGLNQVEFAYALGKRKLELTAVERFFDEINEQIDNVVGGAVNLLNTIIYVINDVIDGINDIVDFFEDLGGLVGFNITIPDIPQIPEIPYSPLGELLDNRIGMLLLEKDSFMVDKLLRIETDGKLTTTQPSARQQFDMFYTIDYFTQYKYQDWAGLPFNTNSFNQIRLNPLVFNNGVVGLIESAQYNIWNKICDIKTKTPYIYTTNLIKTFNEPTGE